MRLLLQITWIACLASGSVVSGQERQLESESFADGTLRVEREVIDDGTGKRVADGKYTRYHENGKRAERGRYRRGVRVGEWKQYDLKGKLFVRGQYEDDRRVGAWEVKDENGDLDPQRSGVYRYYEGFYPDGEPRVRGYLLDDQAHGKWEYLWTGGQVMAEGTYLRGARVGDWAFWHSDGSYDPEFQSGVYIDGVRTGMRSEPPANREGGPGILAKLIPPVSEGVLEGLKNRWFVKAGEKEAVANEDRRRERAADIARAIALLLQTDPAKESRDAVLLDGSLLPALVGGSFGWVKPDGDAAAAANRRAQRRWESVWALTYDDLFFFRYGKPLKPMETSPEGPIVDFPLPVESSSSHFVARYAGRFDEKGKAKLIGKEAQQALELALRWLVDAQESDGRWSSGAHGGTTHFDCGVTALALLALLSDGHTPYEGQHAEAVRRGAQWLLEQASPSSGYIGRFHGGPTIYSHFAAMIALGEVLQVRESATLRRALERAAHFTVQARAPYGGWRYDVPSLGDYDWSATSWALQALFTVERAGIATDAAARYDGIRVFHEFMDQATGRIGYDAPGTVSARTERNKAGFPRESGEALTAAGLFTGLVFDAQFGSDARRYLVSDSELLARQIELLARRLPEWDPSGARNDMYYWFQGSQAMALCSKGPPERWFAALHEALFAGQLADGSWDPNGPWGLEGGRVYSTALLALCLEAPFRHAVDWVAATNEMTRGVRIR